MSKKDIKAAAFVLTVSVAVFFVTGCSGVPKSGEKIMLNGMIYDTQNRPVVNYMVLIDGKYAASSDIGGRFVIKSISKGEHVFSGNGSGYLSIEEKVTVYDKSQILYIRVPSVEARLREAYSLLEEKRYEKAEAVIEDVMESGGENEDSLFFMCVIKHLRGMDSQALIYLEKLKKTGGGRYVEELEKILCEK